MKNTENKWPEIGIVALDSQHAHYHGLIDEFVDLCMLDNIVLSEINEFFAQIIDYSVEHFDAEEFFMRSIDYPDYQEHVDRHDDFRAKLEEMSEKLKTAPDISEFAENAGDWVEQWFAAHIIHDDQKLADYYKAHHENKTE